MSVLDLTGHSFFGVRHQVSFTSCDSHVTSHDPSLSITAPKLNYTILYNSSRALKFQQLIFGSPDKPDGRVGKREGGVRESHPNTHTVCLVENPDSLPMFVVAFLSVLLTGMLYRDET